MFDELLDPAPPAPSDAARVEVHRRAARIRKRRRATLIAGVGLSAALMTAGVVVASNRTSDDLAITAGSATDSVPAPSTTSGEATPSSLAPPSSEIATTTSEAPSVPGSAPTPIPVLAYGDSVMLGAAGQLADLGIMVDASVARTPSDSVELFTQLRDEGLLGDAVIVHVGTNRPWSDEADFTALLDLLSDVPSVILVTVHADRPWAEPNNALIRAVEQPNVTVVDWDRLADDCPGDCLYADDIHLTPDGAAYYASLLDDALGDAGVDPAIGRWSGWPLQFGSTGDDVLALERRLEALGFDTGDVDGVFDRRTEGAVWSFERIAYSANRTVTGSVTPALWQAMQADDTTQPRRPRPGTHVEIYLPEQLLIVFQDNRAALVTYISPGDGQEWCDTVTLDPDTLMNPTDTQVDKDICGISNTPGGMFRVEREEKGASRTSLGELVNPVYFNYLIAIHGADNVPPYPSTRGTVAVPRETSERIEELVAVGDPVLVWNGIAEPEDVSEAESLPVFPWNDPTT
jgi:peptidoglycan hydrolase-like protein with peptidoglycan-binding domain